MKSAVNIRTLLISCATITFIAAFHLQVAAQGNPDRANIELWINNRLSQQLNVPVDYTAVEEFEERYWVHHNTYADSVKLEQFSLAECKLEATYLLTQSFSGASTQRETGRTQYRDREYSLRETITLNVRDLQPSKISASRWAAFKAPNRKDDEWGGTYACSPSRDCAVQVISFAATGANIYYKDSDNVSRMEQIELIPIGRDTEGERVVRALHDEAVSCGAKDVNTSLY